MKITVVESGDPDLAHWLIGYLGTTISEVRGMQRRVIPARPNCFIQIVLEGGHSLIDIDTDEALPVPQVGLFGPLTHHRYDMDIGGPMRTFCVRLQPAAAGQLFGLDPVALVDGFVPLELPPGLLEHLQAIDDFAAMAEPMDRWFKSLVGTRREADPVSQAARLLRQRRGTGSIQELAEMTGLSLRQFQRRFQQLTGLNPKHYGRICRVAHAVHLKELVPGASWTAIALDCGYSDQSHFIRDFKALTATLPRNFLRGQTPLERFPRWED